MLSVLDCLAQSDSYIRCTVCVVCTLVCSTCGLEDAGIALAVPGGKRLHHTINLLGFAGKSEAPQKLPATAGRERKNTTTCCEKLMKCI